MIVRVDVEWQENFGVETTLRIYIVWHYCLAISSGYFIASLYSERRWTMFLSLNSVKILIELFVSKKKNLCAPWLLRKQFSPQTEVFVWQRWTAILASVNSLVNKIVSLVESAGIDSNCVCQIKVSPHDMSLQCKNGNLQVIRI